VTLSDRIDTYLAVQKTLTAMLVRNEITTDQYLAEIERARLKIMDKKEANK
jgi:hypothetical protein